MAEMATSVQERPIFFPSGGDTLFGVVTDPVSEPRGVGVILLYGGGYTMSSYYNQYWTNLARRVAGIGFHALRFDHHGNGDATGRVDNFDHKTPFSDDVLAAIRFMEGEGVRRFLLVGDCLGGRGVLVAAADVDSVEGVYTISAMVRDGRMEKAEDWAEQYGLGHYLRRAFRWKTLKNLASREMRRSYLKVGSAKVRQVTGRAGREDIKMAADLASNAGASGRFLDPLARFLDRGGSIRFVFGDEDEERRADFDQALSGRLGEILESGGARAEVGMVSGSLANIQDPPTQDAIIEEVANWSVRVAEGG